MEPQKHIPFFALLAWFLKLYFLCLFSADSAFETFWVQKVEVGKEREDSESCIWWCSIWSRC